MATQSSILAWEIPWTKEPGGLRVRYDLVAKKATITTNYHWYLLLNCYYCLCIYVFFGSKKTYFIRYFLKLE